MRYYEVWVASQSFHGKDPLTYSSDLALKPGNVVKVPLQSKHVLGIIKTEVNKPNFKTKPLAAAIDVSGVPVELLKLYDWLKAYYPAPTGQITSLFLPSNIDVISRKKTLETKAKNTHIPDLPTLTDEQTAAVTAISSDEDRSFLLHGDTGTGKTRVYIELARKTLASNKSVIILTPEIGLTPQLIKVFSEQFPGRILVTHSHLTPAQRRDLWINISNSGQALVVIGPRSALFTPLKKVGLVVVDECHDNAYKQEQAPHYLATRVAAQLARLHDAKLILGSATPNIADYYTFESKGLPIIRMTKLATESNNEKIKINIVPIRDRDHFTKSAWLSSELLSSIQSSLDNGKQSLIFLNRRGTARVVMCQSCGWQAICPKCDIALTYHGDHHRLRCHTCGFSSMSPSSCPTCKAADIIYRSIGTKSIAEELSRLFPNARIGRFDSDNTKQEQLHNSHESIQKGSIDILVGTQMVTKGLDLPNLSVVGIITADTALSFPDYTAEEITYQQLSQVMGRVGRGHVEGTIVIQTYYPENSALKAAVNKNYSLFYKQQISEREKFLFPPFSYNLKLICSRKSSAAAEKSCQNLRTFISSLPLSAEIIGPVPCFKQKQNNSYYYQLIIKTKKRSVLTDIIACLPGNVSYDIDPVNLL